MTLGEGIKPTIVVYPRLLNGERSAHEFNGPRYFRSFILYSGSGGPGWGIHPSDACLHKAIDHGGVRVCR